MISMVRLYLPVYDIHVKKHNSHERKKHNSHEAQFPSERLTWSEHITHLSPVMHLFSVLGVRINIIIIITYIRSTLTGSLSL